jgi:hypothetical protein
LILEKMGHHDSSLRNEIAAKIGQSIQKVITPT